MFDPDAFTGDEGHPPRDYWALLAWVILMCLVIGMTAYAMFGV